MLNMLSRKPLLLLFAAGVALSAPTLVQAQSHAIDREGYLFDSRNEVARSGFDLCWRTNYWTPAMAVLECDPDLVQKDPPAIVTTPVVGDTPRSQPDVTKVTLAADTLFDFDKATLRPEGRQALDNLIAESRGLALEVIVAVGHTDRIGKNAYNQKLSEQRAASVKQYLVNNGVPADKVYAEGKGPSQPVTGDECRKMGKENRFNKKLISCLQPDRRVDIEVIGTRTTVR